MHIGIDFDDVLYPYHLHLRRRLKQRFGIDLSSRRVTTFYYDLLPEFQKQGLSRDVVWNEVQATWRDVEDHGAAPLLDPDAAPVLKRLGKHHQITVVSARSADAEPLVKSFLKRHRIRPHQLLLGRHEKSGFDVLVDDFPKHALENAESGGISLLYTIDENSTFDESRHARILRVHSWKEVEETIDSLVRRRAHA